MKTLGQKVAEFRASKEWSATQMAREVGTTRQNIQHLEKSGGDFVPHYIGDLARVMGVPADELVPGGNYAILKSAIDSGQPLTTVPAGRATITRGKPLSPANEKALTRLLMLLFTIPEDQQGAALAAATAAMLDHLPALPNEIPGLRNPE